jgi:hypothetical protein
MDFNAHYDVAGRHAFLSASSPHWVNYDFEKLRSVYVKSQAAKRGTELHDFARQCIDLGIKLPANKKSLNQYVNDAIGFRMAPEQVLFYSYNCYGTADAISFRNNMLRVHDLKTGYTRVTMTQLEIYAALFCLEYDYKPNQIDMELRVYQSSKIVIHQPEPRVVRRIMEKIIIFDRKIEELKLEEEDPWQ